MNNTKWTPDPLGRSTALALRVLQALAVALVITGSAWPIQARSVSPILDMLRR